MRYINSFRDPKLAQGLFTCLAKSTKANQAYRLMEFCGGHTHTIHRFALPQLLPDNIQLIHGPGCPVCILPMERITKAIHLAQEPRVILCCYGDLLRIPGVNGLSLQQAKARGADVRIIYSVDDAIDLAKKNPDREIVFFAIGFETTTAQTAMAILQAEEQQLVNFSVFCNHVLTPVAMAHVLADPDCLIDGIIGPAHVSIITGAQAFNEVASHYQKPVVIAGFEPLDIVHAMIMLVEMINKKQKGVAIQYTRAVTEQGNIFSQKIMTEVFRLCDFSWRGIGTITASALAINCKYRHFDAEYRFTLPDVAGVEHKQCLCGQILRGLRKPRDCTLFAKACQPQSPLGACMVSAEGACAAVYAYGRS